MTPVPPPYYDQLCKDLGLRTNTARIALLYSLQNIQLIDRKSLDYGPFNIAFTGIPGVISKAFDKICRIQHMHQNKRKGRKETVRDSWNDLSNYGIIGEMLLDGAWPTSADKN